jgi:hypothetical protein
VVAASTTLPASRRTWRNSDCLRITVPRVTASPSVRLRSLRQPAQVFPYLSYSCSMVPCFLSHCLSFHQSIDLTISMYSLLGYPHSSRTSVYSDTSTSSKAGHGPRSGRGMAGILDIDRSNSRKDRTFIGTECAVCEEPLELTLRGERILQLTCSHVAHEACFYEYIREFDSQYCPTCNQPLGLDSSRGGNVLDLGKLLAASQAGQRSRPDSSTEKLSKIAKAESISDASGAFARSTMTSPMPWEQSRISDPPASYRDPTIRAQRSQETMTRETMTREARTRSRANTGDSGGQLHMRNDSGQSGGLVQSGDYSEPGSSVVARKHDYDVQSMETSLSSPPGLVRNPIPPPAVTVRSEFPTMNRSRQQQSLTCLVTVEVPEGKWRPSVEDIRPLPPMGSNSSDFGQLRSPVQHRRNNSAYETRQQLEEVTEELHSRVDNWHGLDFSRCVGFACCF